MYRFLIGVASATALAIYFMPDLYQAGGLAVGAAALIYSAVCMQLIAFGMEGRWLWPPRTQFKSFIWGDTFCLPLAAFSLGFIFNDWESKSEWLNSTWWQAVCAVAAIVVAVVSRKLEAKNSLYRPAQFNSPTKLWHDYFVIPVMTALFLYGAPAWFSESVFWSPGVMIGLGLWFGILMGERPTINKLNGSHVDYDWEESRALA